VPADITVRRADPAEADLVGALTERVRMLAVDGAARGHGVASLLMAACETVARDQGMAAVILCTETRMLAAQRLYERRGYLRDPARDWQIRNVHLIAYRLPLEPA
jgi:GNAT superfamily N-acetyltransferase